MDDFLNALRFLTRIPVPGSRLAAHANSPAQVPWYGMVGLVVGIVLVVFAWLLDGVPPMVQAALVLVVWIWITGALHLDGLADCGDAWMSGHSGQRFLEILQDTRCGAGALVWVVGLLLVKFSALSVLMGYGEWLALAFAPVLARLSVQVAILRCKYARRQGLGAALGERTDQTLTLVVSAGLVVALAVISLPALVNGVIAVAVGFALVYAGLVRRAGGFTGDIYGTLIEVSETAVLVSLCLMIAH